MLRLSYYLCPKTTENQLNSKVPSTPFFPERCFVWSWKADIWFLLTSQGKCANASFVSWQVIGLKSRCRLMTPRKPELFIGLIHATPAASADQTGLPETSHDQVSPKNGPNRTSPPLANRVVAVQIPRKTNFQFRQGAKRQVWLSLPFGSPQLEVTGWIICSKCCISLIL